MNALKRRAGLLAGAAAALAAVVAVAACGSGSDQKAATPGDSGSPSASHGHGATTIPAAAALRSGERFVNLELPAPYTPKAPNGGTDEYRCFLIDPKLGGAAYLTGSQFLPQNADIVHHAIFFRVDPAGAEAARKVDAKAPGEGWTCFGDADIGEKAAWVGHWAPGANEVLLKPGLGYPMPAGSVMIMQVHYNLLATQGKAGASDQSGVRLRVTDGKTKLTALDTGLIPGPVELPCASGETGPLCDRATAVKDVAKRFGADAKSQVDGLNEYCNKGKAPVAAPTKHCDHQIPGPATVYAVAGHMHLLGRSIRLELNPGTPTAQTLLDIPAYDFDKQEIQPLATPVNVKKGDVLRVTCTHDAGLRKQLPALRSAPARYVVWGDGTSDEMCLGLIVYSGPS